MSANFIQAATSRMVSDIGNQDYTYYDCDLKA